MIDDWDIFRSLWDIETGWSCNVVSKSIYPRPTASTLELPSSALPAQSQKSVGKDCGLSLDIRSVCFDCLVVDLFCLLSEPPILIQACRVTFSDLVTPHKLSLACIKYVLVLKAV